jgi:chromosomal replication initiation ATPase DnaA
MVARHLGCTKKELFYARRGRGADNRGRGIAMKLCQEMGSMKLSDMAALFAVGSDSAVSRSVSRFDELLDRDSEVRSTYDNICREISVQIQN